MTRSESRPPLEYLTLPAEGSPRGASHLAVQLQAPASDPHGWVLYAHGFRSSQDGEKASFFRSRAVAAGLAFCSFDFQGHGSSGGSLAAGTLTRNLDDFRRVHAWLVERGAQNVVLMGSSMGGAAALWHAALESRPVAAILTLAPALDQARRLEAWAGEEGLREWRRSGRRRWEDEMGAVELDWAVLEDLRGYPPTRLAELLDQPVFILQGRLDTSVAWRDGLALWERRGSNPIDLHLFGDADHRLVDRLDRLWELMCEFLRGHGILCMDAGET